MKVPQALKEAIRTNDGAACVAIAEKLRLLGFDYEYIYNEAYELTGIGVAEWDALLEVGEEDQE
tara:strand:+ start:630 stop:821 length:192 start_codon:yes stop_codon:yes gene_type:complete